MDETQIQTLINDAIAAAKTDILTEVTRANQGLAASLTKEIKKVTEKPPAEPVPLEQVEEKLTLKALQQEIKQLKEDNAAKDKAAFLASRDSAISKAIAASKALNPTALQKLFTIQFGDLVKQEGDSWFVTQGDTVKGLENVLAEYLASDEGQLFIPASGVNGSGAQETKAAPVQATETLSTNEAVNAAFANY